MMREFPKLERYLTDMDPFIALPVVSEHVTVRSKLTLSEVLALYSELRAAYLILQRACELQPVVDAAAEQILDPRLPGERRVPTKPGLYLARYPQQCEGWHMIVEVLGQAPYLRMEHFDGREVIDEDHHIHFGSRLAGPGWQKIQGDNTVTCKDGRDDRIQEVEPDDRST